MLFQILSSGLQVSGALSHLSSAVEQAATAPPSTARPPTTDDRVTADINMLFMITQALWELLKTEHGYTDERLAEKVIAIDLSDGRLDGKAPKQERPDCPSCGKKMGRHPACLYCGTVILANPFVR